MPESLAILVNGASGRMGRTRHLEGALLPLRDSEFDLDIYLSGRSHAVMQEIAESTRTKYLGEADQALRKEKIDLLFDASNPLVRPKLLQSALALGIGVYTEKPIALNRRDAATLYAMNLKSKTFGAIVQDKIFTQGYLAARKILEEGLLGEIYDIRCEFGYWVHTGFTEEKINRPSWNFQKKLGGSLIPDLFSHWNYIIELIDEVDSVVALTRTHIGQRRDELGNEYKVDTPDTAHVIFTTRRGITGSISSSWIQRPLNPFTLRVFGSLGSIYVTPTACKWYAQTAEIDAIDRFSIKPEDEFRSQWREVLKTFLHKEKTNFGFDSALRQAAFAEAIEKSELEHRFINVERYKAWSHTIFPLMG